MSLELSRCIYYRYTMAFQIGRNRDGTFRIYGDSIIDARIPGYTC